MNLVDAWEQSMQMQMDCIAFLRGDSNARCRLIARIAAAAKSLEPQILTSIKKALDSFLAQDAAAIGGFLDAVAAKIRASPFLGSGKPSDS